MLIQPNSTINILKNVPLDNTYNHTIWFDNVAAQTTYFASMNKYTFPVQSYQRVNKGVMRLQRKADDIYDCNYLMFQNTSYGNKWFYAFITAIEYVNDVTCEITFEIDPMQTYLFDIELKMCFVEREHSSTDVAGDNVIDEPVNTGDIVCANIEQLDNMTDYIAMIWHAGFNTGDEVGGVYNNLFSGLDVEVAILPDGATSANNLKALLARFTDNARADAIVSLTVMPLKFFSGAPAPHQENFTSNRPTSLANGYVPRNKKLLTFPYNYLIVDCGNDSGVYRYEWFKGASQPTWRLCGYTSPNPQIACIPANYNRDTTQTGLENVTEELIMEGFPQLAYNIDGYRAYLAQTASGAFIKGTENVMNAIAEVNPVVGGKAEAPKGMSFGKAIQREAFQWGASLLENISNVLTGNTGNYQYDTYKKSVNSAKHPNMAKGTMSAGVDSAMRVRNFYFKQMCVSENYARVIDDFFDVYGYATNRVKIPNRTRRPHWNYVKTNGCDVVGNAPADDIRAVCKIYDSGITFWKNPAEVGNYSLNNSL